jgi:hypothetical protein
MIVRGELVQTTAGKWITHPPTRCPNDHRLGPGEVLAGHQACLGHGGFAQAGSFGDNNDGNTAAATGRNSFAEAGGTGSGNVGNTATATDGGTAMAGHGTGNDDNTAIATDGGEAAAAVDITDIDGLTTIAGARQNVTVP